MIIRSNFFERRKQHRFKVKEGAFVDFYKPRFFKLGKSGLVKSASIIDLGAGGLTFQYISRNMWTPDLHQLSIVKTSDKIKINRVPFRAVSDFSISRVVGSMFLRRCGVKFGELTPDQKYQLHYFIQDHTIYNHPVDRRTGKDRRKFAASAQDSPEKRKGIERRKRLLPN
jgi:hypothetical protein